MIYGYGVTMDCVDAAAIADFWRGAVPYEQRKPTREEHEEALRLHPEWATMAVVQDERWRYPRLRFEEVPEPKVGRDRMRWELGLPESTFDAEVRRLIELGATGALPTLSHPAGNDFDVVPVEGDTRFTAIILEAVDVVALEAFWAELLKGVHRTTPIPDLRIVQASDVKRVKNRMHLDLFCEEVDEIEDERRRAVALGARLEDPSTGHQGMFDPEGNEFCLSAALPRRRSRPT